MESASNIGLETIGQRNTEPGGYKTTGEKGFEKAATDKEKPIKRNLLWKI